jgi:hypothetical protein
MLHSWIFGFLGLNVGWGIANLILASKLAEYRVDDTSVDGGMAQNWASLKRRFSSSSYSEQGRRLLPWFRLSSGAQGLALLVWVFVFAPL